MEEEIIRLFNEKKKTYFKEDFKKTLQNRKDLEAVFQIIIVDLKQIIKRKGFLMEINKYKCINMQKMQSKVQDSVENKETHEEMQG